MNRLRLFIPWLTALSLQLTGMAQDISMNSRVDQNPVAVNQQFVYQVELSGSSQNLPDVEMPDFSEFMVVGGPSTSSSIQIVNFKISASRTYSVVLMPRQPGNFKLGPARTEFKGETYQSNVIQVTVVPASQTTPPPATARPEQKSSDPDIDIAQLVFLKAIPSKKTAYINEEITVQYKIYFRANITANEVLRLPEAVGCWVEEYPTARRPSVYNETVNGVRFNVAEIKKVGVFPSRAGSITISPLEMNVDMAMPRQRPRDPFSLFDDFFSDPFSQVVKKNVGSGEVNLTILPLPPEAKPTNFSGLVGDFSMQSTVDKLSLSTDEALTLRVKIAGTGLLKFLNKLPLEFPPDFEVFDPKISESVNKTGSVLSSSKEFEYVIIPRTPGTQKIKSLQLSFFNPKTKNYQILQTPPYTIAVSKGKDLAFGQGRGTIFSKEEVKILGKDIRFIKENLSDLRPFGYKPYRSLWFFLSLLFPVIMLGLAWIYRNHLEKMTTNVQYARSRKAQKMVQKRLSDAKGFWKHHQPALFYGAISNGLIGYIADKSNKPAAGLLRKDIENILHHSQVPDIWRAKFLNFLDEADFRRFAPGSTSETDMKNFYRQAEDILVQFEKYF